MEPTPTPDPEAEAYQVGEGDQQRVTGLLQPTGEEHKGSHREDQDQRRAPLLVATKPVDDETGDQPIHQQPENQHCFHHSLSANLFGYSQPTGSNQGCQQRFNTLK